MSAELVRFAKQRGFEVKEKPLQANDGKLAGRRIAIRTGAPDKEYILAHEIAHAYLHTGDTINSPLHSFYEEQADRGAALILDLIAFMEGGER